MIKITSHGDFKKVNGFLEKCLEGAKLGLLDRYGQKGVELLSAATPVRTGKTAASWTYKIERAPGSVTIVWENTNTVVTREKEVSIALLLQYGHGTRNGGYVKGRDFINPVILPFFDQLADDAWEGIVNRK